MFWSLPFSCHWLTQPPSPNCTARCWCQRIDLPPLWFVRPYDYLVSFSPPSPTAFWFVGEQMTPEIMRISYIIWGRFFWVGRLYGVNRLKESSNRRVDTGNLDKWLVYRLPSGKNCFRCCRAPHQCDDDDYHSTGWPFRSHINVDALQKILQVRRKSLNKGAYQRRSCTPMEANLTFKEKHGCQKNLFWSEVFQRAQNIQKCKIKNKNKKNK